MLCVLCWSLNHIILYCFSLCVKIFMAAMLRIRTMHRKSARRWQLLIRGMKVCTRDENLNVAAVYRFLAHFVLKNIRKIFRVIDKQF